MKRAEYPGDGGCPQRDSAEHEEYAGARSADRRETEEADGADLLERILSRDNLNRAYKRVKANKGAPGIDGMTVEDALPWLREHREELLDQIRNGKYKPQAVRRKEIPKPDGGVRKLGIPTVVDRIIQQAIAQQLTPIYEPLFSDGSYGYRPGRSAQMAIQKVKEYAEQGYFYIASMRNTMKRWDEWLRRRFRMYIWKQWKLPRTRVENLMKLGLPEWRACEAAYSRKAYWRSAKHASVNTAISSKRLAQAGYYSILDRYESLHLCG